MFCILFHASKIIAFKCSSGAKVMSPSGKVCARGPELNPQNHVNKAEIISVCVVLQGWRQEGN